MLITGLNDQGLQFITAASIKVAACNGDFTVYDNTLYVDMKQLVFFQYTSIQEIICSTPLYHLDCMRDIVLILQLLHCLSSPSRHDHKAEANGHWSRRTIYI